MNRRATRWVAWVEPIKPPPDKPVATSGNLGQGENNLQRGEIKLRSQAITTIIFEVPLLNAVLAVELPSVFALNQTSHDRPFEIEPILPDSTCFYTASVELGRSSHPADGLFGVP